MKPNPSTEKQSTPVKPIRGPKRQDETMGRNRSQPEARKQSEPRTPLDDDSNYGDAKVSRK